MNGYRFFLRQVVNFRGEFHHNIDREVVVHARNRAEADDKLSLYEARPIPFGDGYTLNAEYVSEVDILGPVRIKTMRVYTYGWSALTRGVPSARTAPKKRRVIRR